MLLQGWTQIIKYTSQHTCRYLSQYMFVLTDGMAMRFNRNAPLLTLTSADYINHADLM